MRPSRPSGLYGWLALAAGLMSQAAAAGSIELPARVVPDPRGTLHLAVTQPSRVQAPPSGLPVVGSTVSAEALLATLTPALSEPDRRDLGVELAAASRDTTIGRLQLQRFGIEAARQFDVQLPTPTALLVADYRTANGKRLAFDEGLNRQRALRAPQAAVLLRSRAQQDAVLGEGAVLFELQQAGSLAVEAVFTDDDLQISQVREAVTLDGRSLPVRLLAQRYDSALRGHRVLFELAPDAGVTVQQPLRLLVPRS